MAPDTPLPETLQERLKHVREQMDAALEALVAEVLGHAAADRDAVINAAQAEVFAATEKAKAEAAGGLAERLAAAKAEARAEAEAAVAERLAAVESKAAEAANAEIERIRAESEAAIAERVAAATSLAQAAHAAQDAATASLQERLAAMEAQVAETAAEAEQRAKQLEAERADVERRLAEAQAQADAGTRMEERECDLACLEHLVDAVRDLDAASSLSQVLDKLADHAAGQIARVAVFVVRERELRAWRLAGFGDMPVSAAVVSLDAQTVLKRAFETGARATTGNGGADDRLEPPSFAELPADRIGLALPLTVGRRTVAVMYGDEGPTGERTVPSGWPEVLELLSRHAACRLEFLTLARAQGLHAQQHENGRMVPAGAEMAASTESVTPRHAPPPADTPPPPASEWTVDAGRADDLRRLSEEDGSAQRYARLLISEIKLYHEDAVNEGRRDANLLARLGPEIERARRLYEERVPEEVRSRADHFGTELVRTLADGDPRLLGQAT